MDYEEQYYTGFADSSLTLTHVALRGLVKAFKYLFKALVYLPLLATGYILVTRFISPHARPTIQVGAALGLAILLYYILAAVKRWIERLQSRGNLLWIPVLLVFLAFTIALPLAYAYPPLHALVTRHGNSDLLTYGLLALLGGYIYYSYTPGANRRSGS